MAPGEDNALGEFLRSRREKLRPGEVGIVPSKRRRVPGLRREEAAQLAGISSEYYLRLEQGRDQHPSDSVLGGLARAFRLNDDEAAYLLELARPRLTRSARRPDQEVVGEGLRQLLDAWHETPAYVQSRTLDVLASNALARALTPIFTPGVNLVRAAFLDPRVRELWADWSEMTSGTVAGLRAQVGTQSDDPRIARLVTELSAESPEFAQLWSRHEVRPKGAGRSTILHDVGRLDLRYEKLAVGSAAPGQQVVVYHAEPGSPTAKRLAELRSRLTER
jgi:transcriptional regulator with XRE-family HTH domain